MRRRYVRENDGYLYPISLRTIEEFEAVEKFLKDRDEASKKKEKEKTKKPITVSLPMTIFLMTIIGPIIGLVYPHLMALINHQITTAIKGFVQ